MFLSVATYALLIYCIVLGIVVFLNNKKNANNVTFLLISACLGLWFISNYFVEQNFTTPIFWTRTTFFFAAWAVGLFILFSLIFPRGAIKRMGIVFIVITTIMSILGASGLVVKGLIVRGGYGGLVSYNVDKGVLYPLYSLFVITMVTIGITIFISKLKKSRKGDKERLRVFVLGATIAIVVGVSLNLFIPAITGNSVTSKFGFLAAIPMLGFTSYAILKHKFLDIRALVARSVTYILSIVTIASVYGFVAFRVVTLFTKNLTQNTQYAIYTILAVILAFTFQPLRRFFERATDKVFFRDKYDPQVVLNNIGHILASEIRIQQLAKNITLSITSQMKITKADIVVIDDEQIFYQTRPIVGQRHELGPRELHKLAKSVVVADELSSGERKEIMRSYDLSVSLALRTHERFLGYLLLGEKRSGDIYSEADLRLLRIIADELAIAIQNAKSYAEIQQFNETLQTKIAWATQKLRTANADLKELDRAKDEFISMASHQLRTPLTTTKGYVSMVLDGDFGKISTAQSEPLQQALDSANRMAGLVSDLLNVSRMDAGKFFIDAQELDLGKIIQSEVSGLESMAQSKNVKLRLDPVPKSLPLINLDEEKTRQVIMNLVDNAIHYSSPATGGGQVRVSLRKEGQNAVFTVVDNGIGVPDKMKGKLFTKFYRAANAQASRPDGTGLGLYLVKRVVEDQGGELIFESTEGKGSTFGFRFPLRTKFKAGATKARMPLGG